jgi:hypothetical protein
MEMRLRSYFMETDDASKLTIKDFFKICREKFCSIEGAPISRLVDENLRKELAMLAQAETKTKVSLANRNGKPDKSDGLDLQFAKIKKEFTLAQRKIANLKNQLHQAKENMAKEVWNAVPRATRRILRKMKLGARESVNKLSEPKGIETGTFTTETATEGIIGIQDASYC